MHLLLLLVASLVATLLAGSESLALPLATADTATTEGRCERKVNVLLAVETDDKRGDVDDLLADTDVALADEHTGVVDRLGEAGLVDLRLEATLEEVLDLERQNVVEPAMVRSIVSQRALLHVE